MPVSTPLPTVPGTVPETWNALLQALQAQGYDIATITEQGITTINQLKEWAAAQGLELIEISEVVGYTFAKVAPADPANTTAVTTQVVTDIATVGGAGTAVSTVTSGGPKTLGLVSKLVAVSACLSLLVAEIGAGLVPPEVETDLITSADPYTIDGENIPVLIDENGKSYFMEDFIEAIRRKAIELGIFDVDSTEQVPDADASLLYNSKSIYTFPIKSTTPVGISWHIQVDAGSVFEITEVSGNDPVHAFIWQRGTYVRLILTSKSAFSYTRYRPNQGYSETINVTYSTTSRNGSTVYYAEAVSGNNNNFTKIIWDSDIPDISIVTGDSDANVNTDIAYMVNFLSEGGSGGVEGITPASDLITAGVTDLTKKISEVIPELEQNKTETANPTDEDLENKKPWYPVSINTEDVFTDGATEDETSTAPEGNVKPEIEPDILDAIRDLIDSINPNPTVPVDDSGDTPPENPPLTPGSDATGSNGLWSIYNPSLQAVHDFGAWLWSDTLADQFKRIFNSPIDGVIGFHLIYCTPITGTAKPIKCGFLTSPVNADTVANQYVEIDCGNVTVNEYYGNALDYDNTSISIYLPFVGIVPLDTHVVMGSSLNVTYRVDVLTGTCLAQIKVIKQNSSAVMYAFEGNCSVQIPLTGTTYTGMVGALIGGLSASVSFMAGDMVHAVTGAASAVSSAMGGKAGFKQSGTMGSNAGALGIRIPYVIITHPITAMPAGFENVRGLPSTELVTLGSVSGFTSIRDIHLEGIPATAEEINEIKELLAEGVIL